ncbi:MAG TPA: hypothetical protein VIN11_07875 [Roseivirga sp.]
MKLKVILILGLFTLATLPNEAFADRRSRQQRKMMPNKVNKRNKKSLKKWGLAQVINWEEVQNGKA